MSTSRASWVNVPTQVAGRIGGKSVALRYTILIRLGTEERKKQAKARESSSDRQTIAVVALAYWMLCQDERMRGRS